MAKSPFLNRIEAAFGVVGAGALVVSYFLVTGTNPLPDLLDLVGRAGRLSQPETRWTQRVGDQPTSAVAAGGAVIVLIRGTVEARGLGDGQSLWRKQADWAAVAGDETTAVAIIGHRGGGLEAVDPTTGQTRWREERGVAAWTYRDAVLTLSCPVRGTCALQSRAPADGARRWKVTVASLDRNDAGANDDVVGPRSPAGAFGQATRAAPVAVPGILGISVGQQVEVFDVAAGRRLPPVAVPSNGRITVLGGRVVVTTARPGGSGCEYTIEGRNPRSGAVVWQRRGYDPNTVTGAGCEQRRAPTGGGGVLAVTRSDGRQVLLAASDGREVWVGASKESITVVDNRSALVRGADDATVRAVDTSSGAVRWTSKLPSRAALAMCPAATIILDQEVGRVIVYAPVSGRELLSARLSADLLGCGTDGLVLARGRSVGFVAFTGTP